MKTRPNGNKRVLVVGAGFSGLAAAYYLVKSGFDVEVLEMLLGPGGLVGTARVEHGIAETGANGILNSRLLEDLFHDVGCPMVGARREAKARFIFRGGRPRSVPRALTLPEIATVAGFALRRRFGRRSVSPSAPGRCAP